MEYHNLHRTDLKVSKIGLGTWLFGGRRWGRVDEGESIRAMEYAINNGINFIDTSDAYGDGLSEKLIGNVLKGKREDVVIATKVGVVWNKEATGVHIDLSERHIRSAIDNSLKRLKTDYVDIYQLHEMDSKVPIEETGLALRKLLDLGKIRYVGVSNFDISAINQLREIVPVISTQSEYSLIKRSIESDIIPFCDKNKISLFTYSPLYRGILTGKFDRSSTFLEDDNRHYDEEFKGEKFVNNIDKISKLVEVANNLNKKPSQVAIRWLLDNEINPVVICGARSKSQLEDIIKSVNWHLDSDIYNKISKIFIN